MKNDARFRRSRSLHKILHTLHKSYIVVPNDSQIEDITRLDTLCRQFGIGFILFDNQNPEDPNFEIRVRAIKHEPDMFFVNKNLKLIEDKLFK